MDISTDVLGEEERALDGEGGWVKGIGSKGSNIILGERLGSVEFQKEQDSREAFTGTIHSSVNEQHWTILYAY